jgi:hypothetical protein
MDGCNEKNPMKKIRVGYYSTNARGVVITNNKGRVTLWPCYLY